MLWVALHFQSLPADSLERIAAWACQFTPKVSLEPPRELLMEVQGSLRRFGGSHGLLEKLRAGLAATGFEAVLATAPAPRAALWLARGGCRVLEEVPVEAVCAADALEFLRSIGVQTLGELLALPREGLARRCGPALVDDLDRALGALPEGRVFFAPPARFAARLELPAPVSHAEGLLFAARRLLVQLEGLLAARQAGIRGFKLLLGNQCVEIGLASPARDAERLSRLLRERLATLVLTRPVESIGLEAGDFVPLAGRTAGMFGDALAEAEDWAQLLERLQVRLGRGAVHGLATYPDHRPELAWRAVEPGEWEPREFRHPGPRPLWLLEPPRRLGQQAPLLLAGPERVEAGWWDGDEARRDYFIAQDEASMTWVYREDGEWYLHGFFA
ncbi:MAG TPA: DNA polymerase Y family protein [Burkholderiales bacterium]|jgi:protein ImuB|nr:DNA polymerase Y family protein [Burkholderiales bacterium]